MKIRILFVAVLAGVLMQSCFKQFSDETYTIKGRLLKDCSSAPIANREIKFSQGNSSSLLGGTTSGNLGTVTTDNEGRFSFSYKMVNGNQSVMMLVATGPDFSRILERIPSGQNIDDLTAYLSLRTNIKLSLNVVNPGVAGDTLLIEDLRTSRFLKIPCPLTNQFLYTANVEILGIDYQENSTDVTWNFKVNSKSPPGFHKVIITKYCSDTVEAAVIIK